MSWRAYTVTVRLRGTVGERKTATRRQTFYAHSHEDAVSKAKEKLLDAAIYEVKTGDA